MSDSVKFSAEKKFDDKGALRFPQFQSLRLEFLHIRMMVACEDTTHFRCSGPNGAAMSGLEEQRKEESIEVL